MNNNSYLDFPLGPYEAALLAQKRCQHASHSLYHSSSESGGVVKKEHITKTNHDISYTNLQQHTNRQSIELTKQLQQLLEEEKLQKKRHEEILLSIAEEKRVIYEQQKRLYDHEKKLSELCNYHCMIEKSLHFLMERIIKMKAQIEVFGQQKEERLESFSQSRQVKSQERKGIASVLPENYSPNPETVEALMQFHQIPLSFIQKTLIEFSIHYNDTQEERLSWNRTFYVWVVNNWKKKKNTLEIDQDFKPELSILQELETQGIPSSFYEKEKDHFILYWQENKGTFTPKMWQERYKEWIQRAWRRRKNNEASERASRPTTEEFMDTSWVGAYQFNFDEE